MRAAVLPAYGAELQLRDVPLPEPGRDEVVVRVAAAGVCHSDIHLASGAVPTLPRLPWVLGHEISGWVAQYGPDTEPVLPLGTAVAVFGGWGCGVCRSCRGGDEQLCPTHQWAGIKRPGGFAEYVNVPGARHLVPLEGLDPVTSAPLTDAALTPYRAVRKALPDLRPGSTVVVIGAGGLGQFAVQLLRALSPAEVVVVETASSRRELAVALGAREALPPQLVASAGLRGTACAVLDVVGSAETLAMSSELVRPGGLVVIVGVAGGRMTVGFGAPAAEVRVTSSHWGNHVELREVIELARRGHLVSPIEAVPLAQADVALRRLARGGVDGRLVLVP